MEYTPLVVKCERCGYQWTPRRQPQDVKECPSCKTYQWRDSKKIKKPV